MPWDDDLGPLEDESNSDVAGQVVDDVIHHEERLDAVVSVRDMAIMQMEKANLYRILLEDNIFMPGSARQSILESVEKEIKAFIEDRLVELLGIDPNYQPKYGHAGVAYKSPFTDDQEKALLMLADKVIVGSKSAVASKEPAPQPTVRKVAVSETQSSAAVSRPAPAPVPSVKKPQVAAPARRSPTQASQPAPSRPQAEEQKTPARKPVQKLKPNPRSPKPLPMPSADQQEQMFHLERQILERDGATINNVE